MFFLAYNEYFASFSKTPFGQIVVQDLKMALACEFSFKKRRIEKIPPPPQRLFFLVYQPFTQTFSGQIFWQVNHLLRLLLVFVEKSLKICCPCFSVVLCSFGIRRSVNFQNWNFKRPKCF